MAKAKKGAVDKNSRSYLEMQVRNARAVILTVLLCTLVNLVLLLLETNTYFLFSASVPYYGTALAVLMDGGVGTHAVTALLVSAVILAAYLACWLLAKKRNKSLTAALVLFTVDTVALVIFAFAILENPASALLDFVFHGLGIYELAVGAASAAKIEKLASEQAIPNINDVLMS